MKAATQIEAKCARWKPLSLSLIILGTLTRVLPHPPNLTAVGAASLFSGARLNGWRAYLASLAIMAITEPILSVFYGFPAFTWVSPFVYGSFAVNVWVGSKLRRTECAWKIAAASLIASTQFFLITNFAVWAWGGGHHYAQTVAGLTLCYVAGLPYFARTVAGDLLYSGVLFGVHAWLSRKAFPNERVLATGAPATS
jgi:hypothetical protein